MATGARPRLETTYQRAYCHTFPRPTLPPLNSEASQTAPVKTRGILSEEEARKKGWSTTYIDSYCIPQSQTQPKGQPSPEATQKTSTDRTVKSRSARTRSTVGLTKSAIIARELNSVPTLPITQYRGMTLSRGSYSNPTPDPRWNTVDPFAAYK